MIAQLEMFAQNIALLIGALLCLGATIVILLVLYVGTRVLIFHQQQRRSFQAYLERTRRADGKMYPPVHPGFCEQCGRGGREIYHLTTGEKLCFLCYESFWRRAEGWSGDPPKVERQRRFSAFAHPDIALKGRRSTASGLRAFRAN